MKLTWNEVNLLEELCPFFHFQVSLPHSVWWWCCVSFL